MLCVQGVLGSLTGGRCAAIVSIGADAVTAQLMACAGCVGVALALALKAVGRRRPIDVSVCVCEALHVIDVCLALRLRGKAWDRELASVTGR